jgi:diguanylate cyclase (GGDEF)-like protein
LRLLAVLLACAAAGAAGAAAQEEVTLQLNWKHQFQFAGYYAAIEKGYYQEAGFAVRVVEAREGADPIDEVLAGRAQYGIGASELALRRGQGQPLVVLAVILQHSPLALIARGGHAQSVHDLAGKRVMLMPHETELYAYLRREGLSRDKIVEVQHSFNADDLIKGRVDAVSGYSTDEPFELRRAGLAYSIFSPRASGVDFYGDSLFTTEAQVRKDRARVDAFRRASLRGWQYAMDHPAEIADLIRSRYSERKSRAHLLFEHDEMHRLMQPQLVEIGHSNPGRWEHIAQVYAELGMLPREHSLEGLVFDPHPQADLAWAYRGLAAALAALLGIVVFAWSQRRQLAQIRALKAQLEEQAIRDPLTGLYNRRYLDDAIERELVRAQREGYPVSVAMLDLDRFKALNDAHGHPAGDAVLVALSKSLREQVRAGDLACRWGGEEFLLLLPNMPLAAAASRVDKLRARFGTSSVTAGRRKVSATLSAGVAAFPEHGTSPAELIGAADAALYRAKREGRDRVCVAPVPAAAALRA